MDLKKAAKPSIIAGAGVAAADASGATAGSVNVATIQVAKAKK